MKDSKTPHVFSNKSKQWIITSFIYLVIFFFFIWYHDVRGKAFSLLTTEKCTAIASVYCLAMALSLGPLSRFFNFFKSLLPYRRTLGLMAAFMSIIHGVLVFAYLPFKYPEKFSKLYPYSWFVGHWFTIVVGVLCFVLFLLIAMYSYPKGFKKLGRNKWEILQKLSYVVMILAILHLLSMGKIPKNWISWFQTHNKPLPPGSLPTMIMCVIPLVLKGVDLVVYGDSLKHQKTS